MSERRATTEYYQDSKLSDVCCKYYTMYLAVKQIYTVTNLPTHYKFTLLMKSTSRVNKIFARIYTRKREYSWSLHEKK